MLLESDYDMEIKINQVKDLLDKIEGSLDSARSPRDLTNLISPTNEMTLRKSTSQTPPRGMNFASSSVFRGSSVDPSRS